MNSSDYIAIAALLISIASFLVSWYYNSRDKAQIKTSARLYEIPAGFNGKPYIIIKIVNRGKRSTILTLFGGDIRKGYWEGTPLGKNGLRLGEHEVYEKTIYKEDLLSMDNEKLINFWVENTLGQRFKIKNIENLIKNLSEIK